MALHRQRSQTETKNPSRGQSIANLENSRQVTSLRLNLNILTAQKMLGGDLKSHYTLQILVKGNPHNFKAYPSQLLRLPRKL